MKISFYIKNLSNTDSSCKKYVKDEENGLGSLPDAILIFILSLLATKVTARTSVLCKRWRNLWTDVTVVEVELPLSNQSQSLYSIMRSLTSPTLRRFSVITNHLHTFDEARSFKFVCIREVEEIQVTSAFFSVTPCIFRCKTLVNLELNVSTRCTFFDFTTFNLPKLKLLYFSFGKGKSLNIIAMLIKSCPLLETLEMTLESLLNSPCISIAIPNLKSLSLIIVNLIEKHQVIIDTPKLTYLCLVDCGAGMDANDFVREISKFVIQLRSVRELHIESNVKIFCYMYSVNSLPLFRNLSSATTTLPEVVASSNFWAFSILPPT
ncbi:hypothetical protein RDABS01_003797 [Bienertia sinuspersici]